ncbi:MAG: ribonuclease III [Planctomycetota bacterium]|nr:ribonuclease III [Planctomycetota bacterium]
MNDRREPDEELSRALGHRFSSPDLLLRALSHASSTEGGVESNERLEFLGDAVLDLVIGQHLYAMWPDWREGNLTRARAAMVNTKSLADRARELGLGAYARLGKTEQHSGGADKDRVLANLFEAVVGALYLDGGLTVVEPFVERVFGALLRAGDEVLERDPKTRFQEWSHGVFRETPTYRVVLDTGHEGGDERFSVEVMLRGERWGGGVGRSKAAAERKAAAEALERAQAHGDSP